MSYSKKISPLFRGYLNQLESSNEAIEWQAAEPSKFAYKLREALTINPKLKARFIIKVLPGKVRAEPRYETDITGVDKLSKMVLSDVVDLFEVVGAAIKNKGNELYFPNAILDQSELVKLYNWSSANKYYVVCGEGITLTMVNPGEVAWKP
jgi:hypothetical protein